MTLTELYKPKLEMAELRESELPPAQYPKGIMVDDKEYFPGPDDWALEFLDYGGEG